MLVESLPHLLKGREFISMATASLRGEPHASPKLIFKIRGKFIYLIDYAIAKSARNLRENPRASLSFMDLENLEAYRINGSTRLIAAGHEHRRIAKELDRKLLRLSADRIIQAVRTGKKVSRYELEIPDRFLVIKISIREMVRVGRDGMLTVERTDR